MKRLFLIAFLFANWTFLPGQVSHGGQPRWPSGLKSAGFYLVPYDDILQKMQRKITEDDLIYGKKPLNIGINHLVNMNPENTGEWKQLKDGTRLWRQEIKSENALALSLEFDQFKLKAGSRLFLYDPEKKIVLGGFTEKNNKTAGNLPTAFVPGDKIIIELQVDPGKDYGILNLGSITHAIVDITGKGGKKDQYFGDSGDCEIDINCPEGAEWQTIKRSVCRIVFKRTPYLTDLCTGTLINTTMQDGRAYIYTANHCIKKAFEAENAVFYFGYEAEECNGTDPDSTGTKSNTISSASILATSDSLDFSLLFLSADVPESYEPYYAGWSIATDPPQSSVTIHHPFGDVKKISKDADPAVLQYQEVNPPSWLSIGSEPEAFWRIVEWDYGTTEGGSSGSPLFNQNKLIVGNLTGGDANCFTPVNDYFSKFFKDWDYYPEPERQLKVWLDSLNTGQTFIPGYDPTGTGIEEDPYERWGIYPNPTSGIFSIYTDSLPLENVDIRFFDQAGRLMGESKAMNYEKMEFDFSGYIPGMYIIEIRSDKYIEKKKLIIKR